MNAFANEAPISFNKMAAQSVANNIVNLVQKHSFDGVSLEF